MSAPAPAVVAAPRLGVFGGSFDPVHRGHLHAARAAREAFALDHVVFVPAARPPHKPGRRLAPAADRVAMLRLALADEPDASVWEIELERAGPSYTVDTLRELVRLRGARDAPFLILGDDNLEGLPSWREAEAVLTLARPVVVRRGAPDPERRRALSRALGPELAERLERGRLDLPPDPASSTRARRAAAAGEGTPDLPPSVARYVRERGLYRPGGGPGGGAS